MRAFLSDHTGERPYELENIQKSSTWAQVKLRRTGLLINPLDAVDIAVVKRSEGQITAVINWIALASLPNRVSC